MIGLVRMTLHLSKFKRFLPSCISQLLFIFKYARNMLLNLCKCLAIYLHHFFPYFCVFLLSMPSCNMAMQALAIHGINLVPSYCSESHRKEHFDVIASFCSLLCCAPSIHICTRSWVLASDELVPFFTVTEQLKGAELLVV